MNLPYEIGDRVVATALTEMRYDEADERGPHWRNLESPTEYYVVGYVRRQTGTYCAASGDGISWGEEVSDYEPPSLSITGTVLLVQLRLTPTSRIVEAQPEHVALALKETQTRRHPEERGGSKTRRGRTARRA